MLESRKDLKDRIASLEAEVAEATQISAQLDAARAELASAHQELSDLREQIDEAKAALQSNEDTIAALRDDLSAATEKLESFDAEVDQAADAKASAHLQSLGHPPIELEKVDDDPDPADADPAAKVASTDDPRELYHATADRDGVVKSLFARA